MASWDQEPEVLALLACWDDELAFESDGTSSSGSTACSSTDASPDYATLARITAAAPPNNSLERSGRCINVSRERRRQEALQLRTKVESMERTLDELQRRRRAMLQPHFRDVQRTQLTTVAPVWEKMARRQYQARKKSERRNSALRAQLVAQQLVADDLCRALQRACVARGVALPKQLTLTGLGQSLGITQQDQWARLNLMCAQWPSAFAVTPKFHDGSLEFLNLVVMDGQHELESVVKVVTSGVLPFSIDQVESALWSVVSHDPPSDDDCCCGDDDDDDDYDCAFELTHSEATDDTVISAYNCTTTLDKSSRGITHGQWLHKRFGANGGANRLLVTHLSSQLSGFQNEMDGAVVDEDSWIRLVDARSLGHTHLNSPLTVIQQVQCTRIALSQHSHPSSLRGAETLTTVYKKRIQDELEWIQEALESTLLDGK